MRADEHGLGNAARTGHLLVYSAVCSIASHLPIAGSVKSTPSKPIDDDVVVIVV